MKPESNGVELELNNIITHQISVTTISAKMGFPLLDLTLGDSECGCDWGHRLINQLSESQSDEMVSSTSIDLFIFYLIANLALKIGKIKKE